MLVGAGQLPTAQLLDDFRLMAQNKNERHERWRDPNFVHRDGWGMVIGKYGRLECYKKAVACWADPRFNDYYNADVDFVMLHARKASPDIPISYEFTHPFEKDGWYFCHNGTIYDFVRKEKSDAQRLFMVLLHNMKQCPNVIEVIRNTVKSIKKYSALNFILAKNDKAYVLNMYGKYGQECPQYYTMKYLKEENYAIVSSERLQSFDGEWEEMENETILVLNVSDYKFETFKVINP